MELDGTDAERKLSDDRSWIAKNGFAPERLWGRRNVNHGRGVLSRRLVRENLVIGIMCHQVGDHFGMGSQPERHFIRQLGSSHSTPHTQFHPHRWHPLVFNLLTERTLRYKYPDRRSCYRTMMSNMFHTVDLYLLQTRPDYIQTLGRGLANNTNERKVEMDHPVPPGAPAQPSSCFMKCTRTFRSLDHNDPYTAFPSITVANTFVFKTWSAGTSIMSCENTT
jgi:hypothetical protein